MLVNGCSLSLVDASTLAPFPEHAHQGSTWVEGEAGAEFMVRISSPMGVRRIAYITVDGANIGYIFQQGPTMNLEQNLGPFTSGGGTLNMTSFKFARPRAVDGGGGRGGGSIEVVWNEGIYHDARCNSMVASHWSAEKGSVLEGKKSSVGALESGTGSTPASAPWATEMWSAGREIARITLKYQEQAGLVAMGIMNAPHAALLAAPPAAPSSGAGVIDSSGSGASRKRKPAETIDLTGAVSEASEASEAGVKKEIKREVKREKGSKKENKKENENEKEGKSSSAAVPETIDLT